ncbi:RNA-binding domain-containing protein [Fibrella aquatilis]|uniref:DNA binding domain-containing protein n=1 Tax=Fibrella aquatilis TaxID=2817059 RepID=A0A939FZ67_9BACT|nr:RNA-binding domain-containing protein [Fibrella aquatilis]MBO0929442.1 putative DNA binding domain-containing protein [Fibrella aquatilis]
MSNLSLTTLLTRSEGTQLEFKQTLSSAYRIARTLAAFANTSGGTLVIGVTDDKKVIGVSSETAEVETLERATDELIEPALMVSYETRRHDGKTVLLVRVPESDEKPHRVLTEQGEWQIYVRQRDKSVPTTKFIADNESVDKKLLQTPVVRSLMLYLQKHDIITVERLAKLVNISDYRAKKLLRELTTQGLLLFVDQPRPGRYSLKG